MTNGRPTGINERNVIARWCVDMRERLPDGMSVRELTQNALEAYSRNGRTGEVRWAVDPTGGGLRWQLYDTGPGMSEIEMRSYLGEIGGSGGEIGADCNHGIGGKQAGLRDHPTGLTWWSWDGAQLTEAALWIGADGVPHYEIAPHLPEVVEQLPEAIRRAGHGTLVTFPKEPGGPTLSPTPDALVQRLSERYWKIPTGCTLRVEHPRSNGGTAAWVVPSYEEALEHHAELEAETTLNDGTRLRVFVLRAEQRKNTARSGNGALSRLNLYGSKGSKPSARSLVVFDGEVYERATTGATNRVRRFGFTFEAHRVQLVLFPPRGDYHPTDTRSGLEPDPTRLPGQHGLPWDDWARDTRERLQSDPNLEVLRQWQAELEVGDDETHRALLVDLLLDLSEVEQRVTGPPGGTARPGPAGAVGPRPRPDGPPAPSGTSGAPNPRTSTSTARSGGSLRERFERSLPRITWTTFSESDPLFDRPGDFQEHENRFLLSESWNEWERWEEDVRTQDENAHVQSWVRLTAEALTLDAYLSAGRRQRNPDTDLLEQILQSPFSRRSVLRELRRQRAKCARPTA